jgi:tape measure domain-containing protein
MAGGGIKVASLFGLLGIKVDGKSWREGEKKIDGMVGSLRRIAVAAAAAFLGKKTVELSDTYTGLENRLRQVSTSQESLNALMQRTRDIANTTRSDWKATGEAYVRLTNATKELKISEERRLKIVETLNMALQSSGASANEAAAGTLQLMQGLSAGALQGDEFRSIAEQLPDLLDLFAKEMKVSRGELKKLGSEGKITAKVVIASLENASMSIREKFAKSTATAAQGWTQLTNTFTLAAGKFLRGTGIVNKLGEAVAYVTRWVESHQQEIEDFGTAIARGFGVAYDAVTAVFQWFLEHGDLTRSILIALGIALVAVAVKAAIAWVAATWPILAVIAALTALVYIVQDVVRYFRTGESKIAKAWKGLSGKLRTGIKAIGAVLLAPFIGMWGAALLLFDKVRALPGTLLDAFRSIGGKIKDFFSDVIDTIVDFVKSLPGRVKNAAVDFATDVWNGLTDNPFESDAFKGTPFYLGNDTPTRPGSSADPANGPISLAPVVHINVQNGGDPAVLKRTMDEWWGGQLEELEDVS